MVEAIHCSEILVKAARCPGGVTNSTQSLKDRIHMPFLWLVTAIWKARIVEVSGSNDRSISSSGYLQFDGKKLSSNFRFERQLFKMLIGSPDPKSA